MAEAKAEDNSVDVLFKTVVDGGYCVGCGACAVARPGAIATYLDPYGRIQAGRIDGRAPHAGAPAIDAEDVCPFSRKAVDEDELGRRAFGERSNHTPKIGYWTHLFAGHVVEADYRISGSSGGMGSWIPGELLRAGVVDAVLHVRPARDPAAGLLFDYQVSRTDEEVRAGAKSRYYPCDLAGVLRHVRETPGRYLLVALPCFAKAARLIARQDPVVADRLRFVVALICGHLKSTAYASMYAWQAGVKPADLRYIDFRHKGPNKTAKHYFIRVVGDRDGSPVESICDNGQFFGTDWGHGFFKYQACDFCDDVVGETADVSIGDAWLPKYASDPGGTNAIIVRNPDLAGIFESAAADGRIRIEPLTPEDVIRSQDAGFRHRHVGLAYRLKLKDRKGLWRPPKRIAPDSAHPTLQYRLLFRLREVLRDESHRSFRAAKETGDIRIFLRRMKLLVAIYEFVRKFMGARAWRQRLARRVRRRSVVRAART